MFNGVFNELTIEQTVSLASCLVFDEKSDETPKLKEELAAPLRQMQYAITHSFTLLSYMHSYVSVYLRY
jgi:superfamily II RNA helicase